jgi:hypothetical protein
MSTLQKFLFMRRVVILLSSALLMGSHYSSFAQDKKNDREAVVKVIGDLFKAMELGDSAMARNTFAKQVTTATVFRDKAGNAGIHREESVAGFMKAIGTPHKEVWYEEIWNLQVQIDGDFAQAWCDYAFYTDKTFSHCGVDAFHLYRENGSWKIFHLADTRRKNACEIPADIQKKHQ